MISFSELSTRRAAAPWLIVATAALGVSVSFGSVVIFTFGIFLKPLGSEFGWSRAEISLGFSLAALSVAVCSPFIGRWVDRAGARRVILTCVAIYGLALLSLGSLGDRLWQFYATFVVLGVVGNGTTQLSYSKVIAAWFDRRRGIALALMMAGVGVGAMVIPPVTSWLVDDAGWRRAYMALGGTVLALGLIPAALFLREIPPALVTAGVAPPAPALKIPDGVTARDAMRTGIFWMLLASFFLFSVSVNGSIAHLVPMLTDRGIGTRDAAFAVSILGAATLVGRLVTGTLLDRYFGPRVAGASFLIAALGVVIAGFAPSREIAYLGTAMIGLGMGAEADVMPYLMSRYFGLRSFSELFGYAFSAYAVAGALGPWIMARSFDQFRSYAAVLPALGLAMLAASALLFALPRRFR